MMYLKIDVTNQEFRPGLQMLQGKSRVYLDEFSKYVADTMQTELVNAINNQRFKSKWKPLSVPYLNYKKLMHLSLNTWESTGLLKNSIKVYKRGKYYMVGIDKHCKYKGTNVKVYDVAVKLEYGDHKIPARPLFRPIVEYMSKHIRNYWYKFLKLKGVVM